MEKKLAKENNFSSWFLIISIIITVSLLFIIVFKNYQNNKTNATTSERDFEIIKLKGNIIYFNEILTMSARMSSETGNSRWEKRYRSYEVKLDSLMNKIKYYVPSNMVKEFVQRTDSANQKLVEMENDAFYYVHRNQLKNAQLILFSEEYEKQKEIHKEGMTQLASQLDLFVIERRKALNESFYTELWIMGFVILILSVGWYFVFQFQNRTKEQLLNYIELKNSLAKEKEKKAAILTSSNRKLKKAEEKLIETNKELESFSYSISHDLRTPLRAINGYAQILNEDYGVKLDIEGIRILETIKYNATKMGVLIDDLLAFSRLGRKKIQKTDVDLNKLTQNVINDMNNSMNHIAEINTSELHIVNADYNLLYQVMSNLVSNAIKYSSKKENPIIKISSIEHEDKIIITINDNGAGFDMQYSNKLFGVFQRLHSEEEFEGTGVGLAIVQRIISKHGGKVWAEGIVNKGAEFNFSLEKKLN